jgi:two-component system chemotaxis response regulator CheB
MGNKPYDMFGVIAMAASAGGLAALGHVLSSLPENFPAAVTVAQRLESRRHSLTANVLLLRSRGLYKPHKRDLP